jgi:ApbE superfamily uncharacterized protein (UPF0280 family)
MMQAQRHRLSGQRWHFQHGPIDLLISADGDAAAVEAAHAAAWERFEQLLPELVQELAQLRLAVPYQNLACPLQGPVARRMWHACKPFGNAFITPMAAVAGAVAQEIVASYQRPGIDRAWVNNGGDIALHLLPGQSLRVGLYADIAKLDAAQLQDQLVLDGQFSVNAAMPVRGVATSGWRGRSFSVGIADSVTVLARTAAQADAAATVIANAVNVNDARVQRAPASALKDDSDLGDRLVTTHVPLLEPRLVQQALQAGLAKARALRACGLVFSAVLVCQQQVLTTGKNVPIRATPRAHSERHGLVLA